MLRLPYLPSLERGARFFLESSGRLRHSRSEESLVRLRQIPPLLIAASLAAGVVACASGSGAAVQPPRSSFLVPESSPFIEATLHRLTLRQKVAQMVWPTLWGDYTAADAPQWRQLERYVRDEQVGGFTVSVGSPTEIAARLDALQRLAPIPLLIGADLEAGAGFRARGGWFLPAGTELGGATLLPPNMGLGAAALGMEAAAGDSMAYEAGRATARQGRALGIQIAYAPVLDVNNNPANPVINTRSFGEDPHAVARFGAAYIHGMQANGMIATGKHFPGHGDTGVNSHLALPVVHASRARLDSVELVPFKAAIDAGLATMMTFHGSMPALDSSGVPGTLSHKVLTGLLRDEMGFDGLIFTDAMDMKGVVDMFGSTEADIRAVEAGADILLMPRDVEGAIDAVIEGLKAGRYDEARLDASARRILIAKHQLGLERQRLVDLDSARAMVGDSSHEAVARLAAEKSITLVKDSLGQLPLSRLSPSSRILSITYSRRSDLGAGVTFDSELRGKFRAVRSAFVDESDPAPSFDLLLAAADSVDAVIVGSYVTHSSSATSVSVPQNFVDFLAELRNRGTHPTVVAFGNPYLLQQIPDVGTYVIAWGGFPVSQRAAARALLGIAPITGKLPIGIPPLVQLGTGKTLAVSADAAARGSK